MDDKAKALTAVANGMIHGLEVLDAAGSLSPTMVISEVDRIGAACDSVMTEAHRGRLRRLRLKSLAAQGEIIA